MSQPDDELRRRLADLAESAGPWADPLPAVMPRTHAEPRHRPAFPAGRRKWSLAAAVVITLIVGIALAMQMCQRPAPQDRPASNKADQAVTGPPAPRGVGGFAGAGCATVAETPQAGTPALPLLSAKYLRGHESGYAHEHAYPRVLRVHCHQKGNCPRADDG
jgi:hypothetical protein